MKIHDFDEKSREIVLWLLEPAPRASRGELEARGEGLGARPRPRWAAARAQGAPELPRPERARARGEFERVWGVEIKCVEGV